MDTQVPYQFQDAKDHVDYLASRLAPLCTLGVVWRQLTESRRAVGQTILVLSITAPPGWLPQFSPGSGVARTAAG
jgi:hypothetical protein